MKAGEAPEPAMARVVETSSQRVFYTVFLPLGSSANLILGLIVLTNLRQQTDLGWLELGTGALCCMIAGWLAAVAWSRFYWTRNMARQVAVWRRIVDVFFGWLEEAPLPVDALRNLKSSLEDAAPVRRESRG